VECSPEQSNVSDFRVAVRALLEMSSQDLAIRFLNLIAGICYDLLEAQMVAPLHGGRVQLAFEEAVGAPEPIASRQPPMANVAGKEVAGSRQQLVRRQCPIPVSLDISIS
jgi:hypothetical protein